MEYLDFLGELPEESACWQPVFDFGQDVLSQAPYNNLESLTAQIKEGFLDYCKQGIMLQVVRGYRLYKAKYKDFAEYCDKELGRSAHYCRKIIEAAEVTLTLIRNGFEILPKCVAQALPLKKFIKKGSLFTETDELCSNWKSIVDSLPENQITASKIADALDENPEDKAQQVRVGGKTYKLLVKKALAAGMSVSKYLEKLLEAEEEPEPEKASVATEPSKEMTPEQQEEILEAVEVFIASQSRQIADTTKKLPNSDRSLRSDRPSDSS
jgi:hypothetical protein